GPRRVDAGGSASDGSARSERTQDLMAHARWLLAGLVSFAFLAESRAQVVIYPSVYDYGSYTYRGGLGFRFKKRRLPVAGFLGGSYTVGRIGFAAAAWFGPPVFVPYGVPVQNINVIVQPPPTVIVNSVRGNSAEDETAGIDLD